MTLVELLTAAMLGVMVLGSAVAMFTVGIKSEPKAASRSAQIQQARTAMERITRELRQGRQGDIYVATASQLSILTYVKSATCGGVPSNTAIACRVTYTCSAGACTRIEGNPNGIGSGPAKQVVTGLSTPNIFSYSPSTAPVHIGVTLEFPADGGEDAITLQDGVTLRNQVASL